MIDQFYVEGQLQAKFGEHMDGWGKVAIAGWNNGAGGPGARGRHALTRNTHHLKYGSRPAARSFSSNSRASSPNWCRSR